MTEVALLATSKQSHPSCQGYRLAYHLSAGSGGIGPSRFKVALFGPTLVAVSVWLRVADTRNSPTSATFDQLEPPSVDFWESLAMSHLVPLLDGVFVWSSELVPSQT